MIKALLSAMAIAVISATSISVYAQEPAAEKVFTYMVEHDHGIGSGKGRLRITDAGIAYEGDSDAECATADHGKTETLNRLKYQRLSCG